VYEVWFDDIVVATDYIGPCKANPKTARRLPCQEERVTDTGIAVAAAGKSGLR